MSLSERPDEPFDRRPLFWGGQVRSMLYVVGGSIAAWQVTFSWGRDLPAIGLLVIFIALAWLETCPVCGKTWWSHRTEGMPNLFKMMFVSRADCPDLSHQRKENDIILPFLIDADSVSLTDVMASAHHGHGH